MKPYPVHPLLQDDFEEQLAIIEACRVYREYSDRENTLRVKQAAVWEKVLAEIQDELWPNSAMRRVIKSNQPKKEETAPKPKISPRTIFQDACSKRLLVATGTHEAKELDRMIYEFLCEHLHFLQIANLHARRLFIQSERTSLEDLARAVEGLDWLKENGKEQFLADVLIRILHAGHPKEELKQALVNIVYGLSCSETFEALDQELIAEVYTEMF